MSDEKKEDPTLCRFDENHLNPEICLSLQPLVG